MPLDTTEALKTYMHNLVNVHAGSLWEIKKANNYIVQGFNIFSITKPHSENTKILFQYLHADFPLQSTVIND